MTSCIYKTFGYKQGAMAKLSDFQSQSAYIRIKHFLKVRKNRTILSAGKLYHYKQHGFIMSMENVILTTHGTTGCMMSGRCAMQALWQMVRSCNKAWHIFGDVTHTVTWCGVNVCNTNKDDTGKPPYLPGQMMVHVSHSCAPCPTFGVSTGTVNPLVGLCGLFASEVWGVEQDLILYVGQLELSNVSVEGWIIDAYVHGLLGDPRKVAWLPAHDGKILPTDMGTCDVGMIINGGQCPEMFC